MLINIVYFRIMRRLCRHKWNWLWNWLCMSQHLWQRSRDHGVWRLTLTAYSTYISKITVAPANWITNWHTFALWRNPHVYGYGEFAYVYAQCAWTTNLATLRKYVCGSLCDVMTSTERVGKTSGLQILKIWYQLALGPHKNTPNSINCLF